MYLINLQKFELIKCYFSKKETTFQIFYIELKFKTPIKTNMKPKYVHKLFHVHHS